jgi:hypothetical protein
VVYWLFVNQVNNTLILLYKFCQNNQGILKVRYITSDASVHVMKDVHDYEVIQELTLTKLVQQNERIIHLVHEQPVDHPYLYTDPGMSHHPTGVDKVRKKTLCRCIFNLRW